MNINQSHSESYKNAGVDVTAGYRAIELIKKHIQRTKIPGVLDDIGGFGGLFALPKSGDSEPVLVSGTDGVGTKLKIAFILDQHDTIGIDCVAMCVNDIICAGAKPLFFLDYLAMGKNIPEKVEKIVSGIVEGCIQAGCALIGGETAEMPGFYPENEYDLAGFSVGIVEKSKIPNKNNVKDGDVIIGIPSSGLHSNGFSLVRKVFNLDGDNKILEKHFPELNKTLGEELLTPTKIFVKPVLQLLEKVSIRSLCNITGGGFYENIPRAFGNGLGAVIKKSSLTVPVIFDIIQKNGSIPEKDMFNTFNMGTGMCIITAPENAGEAVQILNTERESARIIGEIKNGIDGIIIE
jgi:phosphoribosylformylglycinamidine cyclo-ligase